MDGSIDGEFECDAEGHEDTDGVIDGSDDPDGCNEGENEGHSSYSTWTKYLPSGRPVNS